MLNVGHELTREARAGMQRGWSMGQRALVLILADICNDRTRRQPPHMDVSAMLREELGIGQGTLKNILSRLADDGFEFRVVVGKDKLGRLVFAHRGHAVDYQFPRLPPRVPKGALTDAPKPVDSPEKGALTDAPFEPEGALADAPSREKGALLDAEWRTPECAPDPSTPNSQKMTPGRAGPGPAAATQDLGQDRAGDFVDGEGQPIANSHNPRVHDRPGNRADDAQNDGVNHSPAPAADRNARARFAPHGIRGVQDAGAGRNSSGATITPARQAEEAERARQLAELEELVQQQPGQGADPGASAPSGAGRRCAYGGCPAPAAPLPVTSRYHIACEALGRAEHLEVPEW